LSSGTRGSSTKRFDDGRLRLLCIAEFLALLLGLRRQLAKLEGNDNEPQGKLALIETLTKQSAEVAEQLENLEDAEPGAVQTRPCNLCGAH
jgi:hypothetical protein